MGCGQSKKIHLYPRKNKSKSNGKKGHGKRENEDFLCYLNPISKKYSDNANNNQYYPPFTRRIVIIATTQPLLLFAVYKK